jgi:hypothetical protein
MNRLRDLKQSEHILPGLNDEITPDEVNKVVLNAKNNKAVGIDNLPTDIFKNKQSNDIFTSLFNKMYQSNVTPSIWSIAIIKPIPKNSLIDPRHPLQYRGISLLSTVYKLFTSILNNRITACAETNDSFVDEQN